MYRTAIQFFSSVITITEVGSSSGFIGLHHLPEKHGAHWPIESRADCRRGNRVRPVLLPGVAENAFPAGGLFGISLYFVHGFPHLSAGIAEGAGTSTAKFLKIL